MPGAGICRHQHQQLRHGVVEQVLDRQPLAAAAQAAAQQAARDEAGRVRTALEQQHERRLAELRADLQGRLASSEQVGKLRFLYGCLALAEQVGLL